MESDLLFGIVMRMKDLQNRVREIPHSPGVYLMKDSGGTVIYVGKAKDLRKRVYS